MLYFFTHFYIFRKFFKGVYIFLQKGRALVDSLTLASTPSLTIGTDFPFLSTLLINNVERIGSGTIMSKYCYDILQRNDQRIRPNKLSSLYWMLVYKHLIDSGTKVQVANFNPSEWLFFLFIIGDAET